jgi:hypothetical protein
MSKSKSEAVGDAMGILRDLIGEKVVVETDMGVIRHGRLTKVRPPARMLKVVGVDVAIPSAVILDGDECDPIPIANMVRVDLVG